MRLIGLALLAHILRSRRFYERLATGAIVLAALSGIGKENRANTLARLAAWNKKQVQHIEHQAERQAHHLERQAERQAHRIERQAKRLERKAKASLT